MREIVTDRTAAGPYETKWSKNKKKNCPCCTCYVPIQTMKAMTNGATLIKKGAAEFHKLLPPRCRDHPALLLDDAAKAVALLLPLLLSLMLLELVELLVVVPVGDRTVGVSVGVSTAFEVSVDVGVVTELEIERDVTGIVGPDDEVLGSVEAIRVMAKAGLVSPESPNKTMR